MDELADAHGLRSGSDMHESRTLSNAAVRCVGAVNIEMIMSLAK